jgi:hypothetical protein
MREQLRSKRTVLVLRLERTGNGKSVDEYWVERFEWFWLIEFFGVLRCAQDDGRNRQRQEQATAGTGNGRNNRRSYDCVAHRVP